MKYLRLPDKTMKLKEMSEGVRYIVVTNGTALKKGDHVVIDSRDGALICREAGGWLNKDDWVRLRNRVKIDTEYYARLKLEMDDVYGKAKKVGK